MNAPQQRSTVVGVFEDRLHADQAVGELLDAGFRKDQIGVAMRHDQGAADDAATDADDFLAGSGALTGALTGLGLGALAGLGVLAGIIPVVGPAIAAGTLGVIMSNAAAGAGIAGLVGALVGAGIPEHEAEYYHGELESGRTIVTVTADGRADQATAILRRLGAYDMTGRGSAAATPQDATRFDGASARVAADQAGDTIELKEERLHAEKRPVETGQVTVRKEIHTETETLDVPVTREEIVIERTPVHGRAAAGIASGDIREGEVLRIPVSEERVHLTKEAVVTEEVKVGKRVVHDIEQVSGQVRKEEVKIDRVGDVDVEAHGTGNKPA